MMEIKFDSMWNKVDSAELIKNREFFIIYDLNDTAAFSTLDAAQAAAKEWIEMEAENLDCSEMSWQEIEAAADKPSWYDLDNGDVIIARVTVDEDVSDAEKVLSQYDTEIKKIDFENGNGAYAFVLKRLRERGREARAARKAAKKAAKEAKAAKKA
jgi:hypothetical protein